MSTLSDILNKTATTLETGNMGFGIEPYDLEINGVSLGWNVDTTAVRFDNDGDLRIDLNVDTEDLLQYVIEDKAMIEYLEGLGYIISEAH